MKLNLPTKPLTPLHQSSKETSYTHTMLEQFSPVLASTLEWPLVSSQDEHIRELEQNKIGVQTRPDPFRPQQQTRNGLKPWLLDLSGCETVALEKKRNHNESERERRKRLNNLYSSLNSLLPASSSDLKNEKSSIPKTVSSALKYIPELQKQVKRLNKTKEELRMNTSAWQDAKAMVSLDDHDQQHNTKVSISAFPFGDREVMMRISTVEDKSSFLSEALRILDNDDIRLVNASSFKSFRDTVFYSLHLQVQEPEKEKMQLLLKKLYSILIGRKWTVLQNSGL